MRFLIILSTFSLIAVFADDTRNSKTWNLINAHEAYRQGITGKGVNVGIADSPLNKNHISLRGKVGGELLSNRSDPWHGTAVASLIAGNKIDNFKPYGVAYDSVLYSYQATGGRARPVGDFFTKNGVKIINASWGFPRNSWVERQQRTPQQALNAANIVGAATHLYNLSRNNQTLLVFASGNETLISPQIIAAVPTYDENLRSIINVGSLNPDLVFKQGNKIRITAKGTQTNGNVFLKSENYSLMAFGANINFAYAVRGHNWGYVKASGTSVAAPMVSGAAALVAQKFPFLNGKQIADVLLSTANKDYQAPKLVVKRSYENYRKFSIAYIDNTPPTDDETIKRDLMAEGYTAAEATNIVNNLVESNAQYGRVFQVSKETIYGQGILDIGKAIKGPSILDANRLNLGDIQEFGGKKEAYYVVNTGNYDGHFENDIGQKKWDDNLHLINALNSPREQIKDLDVGLIKQGSGHLVLTGNNSYRGNTIIQEGKLSLLKRQDRSGGVLDSDVLVSQGAIFAGNGTINKDVYNAGTVRAGNGDLQDLNVLGSYTQNKDAHLQLEFGNTKNSKLIANNYNINGGYLEYIPIPAFYTNGHSIKLDLGNLAQHINNFDYVKVLQNNSMEFAILASDNVSINKRGKDGHIEPIMIMNNPNGRNIVFELQVANKEMLASILKQMEAYKSSQKGKLRITTSDKTINHYLNTSRVVRIVPIIKPQAYAEIENDTTASALRNIRGRDDLSDIYKNHFTVLDYVNSSAQSKGLSSIESLDGLKNMTEVYTQYYQNIHNNFILALNQSFTQDYLAQNTKNDPVLLASLGAYDFYPLLDEQEQKTSMFYISPRYKKVFGKDYNGNLKNIGLNVGSKTAENGYGIFNFSVFNSKLNFNYSNLKTDGGSASYNHNLKLEHFNVISSASLGVFKNYMQRTTFLRDSNIESSYYSFLGSAQLGLSKDFDVNSFRLTPLAYFNYSHLFQESFKENQAPFSKSYDSINHDSTSLAAGLNAAYLVKHSAFTNQFSTFAIYEHRLSGKNLRLKSNFRDFSEFPLEQHYQLPTTLVSLGAGVDFFFDNSFFTSFKVVNEFIEDQYNLNLSMNVGFKF